MSTRAGVRVLQSVAIGTLMTGPALAQAPASSVPAFPAQTEVVTVDVVVLDKDGRPIRGLQPSDFIVQDDGQPQSVVAFEARDLAASVPAADAAATAVDLPRGEGEERETTPGRTLAIIVDDGGISHCATAIEGIQAWVREKADPRDELTLLTTSGAVAWTGRVGSGRGELSRALSRIRCGRPGGSDWHAYQTAGPVIDRPVEAATGFEGAASVGRPTRGEKWHRAQLVMIGFRKRARALVATISTFSRAHASERGRKVAVIFTESFIQDHELKPAEQAIDAAQRGNVALYVIDPRGLVAGDPLGRVAEYAGELAGAEQMADETGGTLMRNNDLRGALAQMADESAAYYLLGYQSARVSDGQWHKLKVTVNRPGVTVRARRGYYASARPLTEELTPAPKLFEPQPEPTATEGGQVLNHQSDVESDGPRPDPKSAAAERVPEFSTRAEIVTVDVVVLGQGGRPMRGLTSDDFTVEEDGWPQPIVAFEARDLGAPIPAAAAAAAVVDLPRAEGEEAGGTPGRTLALIVDDIGLDARGIHGLRKMKEWVQENTDPRDELTLLTTSREVEWTGTVGAGRGELMRALGRIRCQRPQPSFFTALTAHGKQRLLSEWEAYEMVSGHTESDGNTFFTAQQIVNWWRDRARSLVRVIETFSRDHAAERGRKTAVVFTQGFIRDDELKPAEQATDAAQRGNVALYFIDPRGLIAGGGVFPDNLFEATHGIDLAGAQQVADETGGDLLRNNDLKGSLKQFVDESAAYYLLGYPSGRGPDDKWHKLRVKVDRQGVTVRARHGYYASTRPLTEQMAQQAAQAAKPEPQRQPQAQPEPAKGGGQILNHQSDAKNDDSRPDPKSVPEFATRAEAVNVDVVILGKDGQPVTGLEQTDFVVLEDGRPQELLEFVPQVLSPVPGTASASPATEVVAREPGAPSVGRRLAFVIDDLGLEPVNMPTVATALSRWLKEGADPRDEVSLVTSSGGAWWQDSVGAGRADFEAVVARIKGKKRAASSREALGDWEAYAIDTLEGPGDSASSATGPPSGMGGCTRGSATMSVLENVVDRWLRTGGCLCDTMDVSRSIRFCRDQARMRARETYSAATERAKGLLGAVERVSRGLAGTRGRKSVVILSEGFLRDTDRRAFERAVDASRRGNTSVSFVDVRGLLVVPFYSAEQSAPPSPGESGALSAVAHLLDTAGGEYLAETTGGSVLRDTNDIAGAVKRLADESSAYYILGYQSDRPLDGKWHKLEVKVSRPGVSVRARRGYFATVAASPTRVATAPKKQKGSKKKLKNGEVELPVRTLDPALFVSGTRDEIPLRIAPHVLETDAAGTVRILVAVEVDSSQIVFNGTGEKQTAALDVTLVGICRDQSQVVPLDSHVTLGIDAQFVGGWWVFSRELRLPAGEAQIRVLVRDVVSGKTGLVAQRLSIPAAAQPYVSTPLFTLRDDSVKGAPRMIAVARREFQPRGFLYCGYEIYPAPGRDLQTMPQVNASYTIRDESGRVVAGAAPSQIGVALGGQIQRILAIPLERLAPGHYNLQIEAEDRRTGLYVEAHETFVSVPPLPAVAPAAAPR